MGKPYAGPTGIYVTAGLVLAGVLLYLGFVALDGWGLEEREARARVVDKEVVEAGSSYATQVMGRQRIVLRQATPEIHVLVVELEDQRAPAAAPIELWTSVEVGDEVTATYEVTRIRGTPRVLTVGR